MLRSAEEKISGPPSTVHVLESGQGGDCINMVRYTFERSFRWLFEKKVWQCLFCGVSTFESTTSKYMEEFLTGPRICVFTSSQLKIHTSSATGKVAMVNCLHHKISTHSN
jgi:hypothetical protein